MLCKAGCHCNSSYDVTASISVRRKVVSGRGLQDPFPQVSPTALVRGGLTGSGIAIQPSVASPSSSEKPQPPVDHFPLDTYLTV